MGAKKYTNGATFSCSGRGIVDRAYRRYIESFLVAEKSATTNLNIVEVGANTWLLKIAPPIFISMVNNVYFDLGGPFLPPYIKTILYN